MITWADGADQGQVAAVRRSADEQYGPAQADRFYFGTLPGETGNSSMACDANAMDAVAARNGPAQCAEPCRESPMPANFNRDAAGRRHGRS